MDAKDEVQGQGLHPHIPQEQTPQQILKPKIPTIKERQGQLLLCLVSSQTA